MTREQQKKLKVLKSTLMKTAQPFIKRYQWKKKDFMIWFLKDELYFSLLLSVGVKDGHCFCAGRGTFKPLWSDNILWEILGMESNKEQPLSLRSIGAFTIYGAELYKEQYELLEWASDELEVIVEKITAEFQKVIQSTGVADFYRLAEKTLYQSELLHCVILIYQEKYESAIAALGDMDTDLFSNEGKGFRERAFIYVKEKMAL